MSRRTEFRIYKAASRWYELLVGGSCPVSWDVAVTAEIFRHDG